MEDRLKIGFHVHTLDRMIGQSFHRLYDQENLTKLQSWIIRYLYDNGEKAVYQRDIEAVFHIPRSTVTGILQGLEKQGYLLRKASEKDARLKRLELTQKAVRLQDGVVQSLVQTEELLVQGISREELQVFLEVLDKMQQNLSTAVPTACCREQLEEQKQDVAERSLQC